MEYQSNPGGPSAPSIRRSALRRTPLGRVAALLVGAALFGGTLTLAPATLLPLPAASALEHHHGPGINWGNGIHVYGAGAFVVNGKFVYCVEPWVRSGTQVPDFVGSDEIPGNSSDGVSVATTTGVPLRQITYLMTRYGQTNDNMQAAAVALAIWEIRGAEGRGNAAYLGEVAKVHRSVGPDVVSFAAALRAEAAAWTNAIDAGASHDTPSIGVTAGQPYRGTVSVPLGTLSLHIENGVFSDGSTTRSWGGAGAPLGTSLTWEGRPAASSGWDRFYRVSFTGNYLEVAKRVQWGDGSGSQSAVSIEEPLVRPLQAAHADLDTTWAPLVSSMVTSKFVEVGEHHSDDVIFAAAPAVEKTPTFAPTAATAAAGLSGDWRWRMNADGAREWMPIKATVTAYGPFLTDPALNPSPEAPVGAPVAARASFTTDTARDHSTPQRYAFVFDDPIAEQGYYTYQWSIDANDQDPTVGSEDCVEPSAQLGCKALPKNYYYSDGFGAANETQVGKMQQSFTTKLSMHEIGLGDSFTDTITVPAMQNWLRDDAGERMPLTLTGTAYLVSGVELAQTSEVPTGAVPLATVRVTTDPQQNGQQLVSEAITIPVNTAREHTFITMRWCIIDEHQETRAQGFWQQRCDDFGVPDESAQIVHPEVRTEAKPLASVEDPITDTAVVGGLVPENSQLVFEVFKKPEAGDLKRDAEGNITDAKWQQSEIDALAGAPLCTAENRVARTPAVHVEPGRHDETRYTSPEVRVTENGVYWWIESLVHLDPESGAETVLLSGACGLPHETTTVTSPQPEPEPTPPAPVLAVTGFEGARGPVTWGAAGLAGVLLTGGAVLLLRRLHLRRQTQAHADSDVRDCEG